MAWRDAAMLRAAQSPHSHHDPITYRTETGIGQRVVLSGFLFIVLTNGLAATMKHVGGGVKCGQNGTAPRIFFCCG